MNRLHMKAEFNNIVALNIQFKKLQSISQDFVKKLHEDFINWGLSVNEISNNSFGFSFWGLNFIVKSELSFNKAANNFTEGALNTYLNLEGIKTCVVSFKFDILGNINRGNQLSDFSAPYYIQFVEQLLNITEENAIMFQL